MATDKASAWFAAMSWQQPYWSRGIYALRLV